ncbi:hypothetical protein GCM10028805_40160 [Spirosoma harenae]
MKFKADSIDYWSENGVETVFFGHEEKELALLVSNFPGTSDHYLEWNDQSNAYTNAVKTIQLSGQQLQIHLLPEAAKHLGISDFVVALAISEDEFTQLSARLSIIFGDQLIIKKTSIRKNAPPTPEYSKVKYLNLEGKNLKTLPDYVQEMTSLETAKLARNPKLDSHAVCEVLAKLPAIKELTFTTEQAVPENIGQLSALKSLNLTGFISPQILPESIGQLKNLTELRLMSESDVILPESFADLANLEELTIRAKSWQLPSKFYQLSRLQLLDFSNCRFTHVPEEMAGMTQVKTIYFDSPEERDYSQIVSVLAQMPNLKELELSVNPIPKEIGLCTQIEKLTLWPGIDPQIPLQLPDELVDLQQLKTLLFHRAYFDKIPSAIGHLSGLEELAFHESDFEQLPDSVGALANLTFLTISENPSLRTLPESLGNLTKLKELCLNENPQLTHLPDSLKKLTNLEAVRISNREAIANIPESWNTLFTSV